jgi:DNA-binding transcriptional regulator YiaG
MSVAESVEPIVLYLDQKRRIIDTGVFEKLMDAYGWRKERFAVEMGISLSTLYRWESGNVQPMPGYMVLLENFVKATNEKLANGELT